jgi:hypothetical protein
VSPCEGEPHARFDAAAGGDQRQSVTPRGQAPPADPTSRRQSLMGFGARRSSLEPLTPFRVERGQGQHAARR